MNFIQGNLSKLEQIVLHKPHKEKKFFSSFISYNSCEGKKFSKLAEVIKLISHHLKT